MARADRNILLRLKSRNPLNLLVSEFLAYIIRFSEFNYSLFQQINRVSNLLPPTTWQTWFRKGSCPAPEKVRHLLYPCWIPCCHLPQIRLNRLRIPENRLK